MEIKRTYRSTSEPVFARLAEETKNGGSSKLEVADITALTEEELGKLNVGDVVAVETEDGNVEYTVNLKKDAGEGPTPVATIDGVDYYHKIIVDNLNTTPYNLNIETGELVETTYDNEIRPYIFTMNMGMNYFRLEVMREDDNDSYKQCSLWLTYGPPTSADFKSGVIDILSNEDLPLNSIAYGLYDEYFSAGYIEANTSTEFSNAIFYFNLTTDVAQPAKLNLVSVDSENVVEVKYEDNTYSTTAITELQELPETLGTAGQVLTVNEAGTGVEWADAQCDGDDIPVLDIDENSTPQNILDLLHVELTPFSTNTFYFKSKNNITKDNNPVINNRDIFQLSIANYGTPQSIFIRPTAVLIRNIPEYYDLNFSALDVSVNNYQCVAYPKAGTLVPNLPGDASSKTYVLKAVNGTLTWVEETSN